jgi:aminoglycoside phosphotransferase (APT) family kinase protein
MTRLNSEEPPSSELPDDRMRSWLDGVLGETIVNIEPLDGATTARVSALETMSGRFVLKEFVDPEFLADEPDGPKREASALGLLAKSDIPAPRPIAADIDGSQCGVPVILMTRVEGEPRLEIERPKAVAEVLAAIHRTETDTQWSYKRYKEGSTLRPPPWSEDPTLWERAFAVAEAAPPPTAQGFIHRDFHHDNVLWRGNEVSGVIDWHAACKGPLGIDLSRWRLNAMLRGMTDDRLLEEHRRIGPDDAYHPHWDVVDAVDILPAVAQSQARWPHDDVVWASDARQRLETFIGSALAEIG